MSLNKYLMIKSAVRYDNYGMAIPDDSEPEPGVPLGGGRSQWEPDADGYIPAQYEYNEAGNKIYPAQFALGLTRKQRDQQGYKHDANGNIIGLPPNWDRNKVLPAKANTNRQIPTNAIDKIKAAITGAAGTAAHGSGAGSPGPGGGALPPGVPPFIADDWDRAEYYRAMANKENNLGALTLGGGALTGGIAALLLNKYYNKDKFRSWLDEKLKASPDSRYGRTIGSINMAISELLPGMSTAAASLLGGIGTRWLANKLHKRYKRIPKPGTASELAAAAKEEYLNGGFDGTNLPGGWYVPPVENSKGILRPAYGVADPVPAPEQSRGVEYWNPQVKSGPIHRT